MHRSNQRAAYRREHTQPASEFLPILRARPRSLLCGTALATTLVVALPFGLGFAQVINIVASPAPVTETNTDDCVSATDCIFISTVGDNNFIDLTNSGALNAARTASTPARPAPAPTS